MEEEGEEWRRSRGGGGGEVEEEGEEVREWRRSRGRGGGEVEEWRRRKRGGGGVEEEQGKRRRRGGGGGGGLGEEEDSGWRWRRSKEGSRRGHCEPSSPVAPPGGVAKSDSRSEQYSPLQPSWQTRLPSVSQLKCPKGSLRGRQ